jgi:DNA-directed RNA polymerase subunit beta
MNKIFVNNIGDLAEAQRASFFRFLCIGISEELINFPNPFRTKIKVFTNKRRLPCLVYLYTNEIKLKGPNIPIDMCLKRDLSYAIQLYVPGEYSYLPSFPSPAEIKEAKLKNINLLKTDYKLKKIRVKHDIFFGEIPLMTEEGTFIVSGCERIVISQIIRSPGIYFKKEFGTTRKTIYTATVISNRGSWTKFVLDKKEKPKEPKPKKKDAKPKSLLNVGKDRIYIKLNEFKQKMTDSSSEEKEDKDNDINKLFVYDILRYFGVSFQEMSDSLKYPLHLFNQQLEAENDNDDENEDENDWETEELDTDFLIRDYFENQRKGIFSIGEIGRYKINKKLGLNIPKDITHLTAHDFIGIVDGLTELKYYDRVNDDIDDIKNKQIRCIGELLQNQIRVGFFRLQKNLSSDATVPNSQKLNLDLETYSDPEEWIIDPRPLTYSIKEFFKTSQLSQFMDQVNPLAEQTHKRRISVFGPNGLKRDHISTVIRDIHPSQYGRLCPIETPEGQNAGLITSVSMFGRLGSLGSIETPYFLMDENKVFNDKSPIFLNPEQESETKIAFCDVSLNKDRQITQEYLSVKENFIFSVKKPKDVSFMTMSPLQIVSLATSLIPFLEHNDANRALMGSNMQRQAVPLLYTQKPIVGTGFEPSAILDSGMVIKSYCQGKVEFSSGYSIQIKDLSNQSITYYLRKYYRSNQETCTNQRPAVWIGEDVFSGQIIADGPSTNDGELSLGRNLTIAYMPWEGYNYEDAIVISERMILEDCLTSVHIEEHETSLTYCLIGSEVFTKDLPHLTKYIRRHLNSEGIVTLGSYVKTHDILVGKLTPCEEDSSPEAKLLRALYGQKSPPFRDTSLRVPPGTEGRVIEVRVISNTFANKEDPLALFTTCETIRIYIAQIRKIQVGDKLAGRHGNKGIISRILPRQDMPYLPDGTPVDIIFNPLGVPSRMNVGQVFECLLGLAGEKLGKRFKVTPFDEIYGKEASRVLVNQKLKEAAIKTNCSWIFNTYYPGKILLRDGRTGEYFDNPITVGKSYILKLIHLVEDKIHARATGPYSMITEQPLAGKSQRGGQRFGEMEVWALEAYGCSNTLQELLTIKSDDIDGRNDMYEAILVRKEVDKPTPSIPESFLALIRELQALGLDFSIYQFDGGFDSTTKMQKTEKDIFQELETRLKLRALLVRKKAEQFANATNFLEEDDLSASERLKEKTKVIDRLKRMQEEKKN